MIAPAEMKASVVCAEIQLNKIARHFGIQRKFSWEDSLVLRSNELQGIILQPEQKEVYIFHFGGLVFVNCQPHEMMDISRYLKTIDSSIAPEMLLQYTDDYRIDVDSQAEQAVNNDYMVLPAPEEYVLEIAATILAKSVSLEKIELDVERVMDDIEEVVNHLHRGKLGVSDEQLGQLSANILRFKLSTISYIMLLDKPDITWNNEGAAALFSELSTLFELSDRYEKLRHKVDTLLDITQIFAGLAHSKRGTRLEWAVIILIAIEIVLSLVDLFSKRLGG